MLDLADLASNAQDRFGQVQDMSVIEEEIILNHVPFNICPSIYLAVGHFLYLAVGHFVESHPGNVDWILSMTCIICM